MSVVKPVIVSSWELTCQFGVPAWVFSQATGFTTGAVHGLDAAAGVLITSVGTTTAVSTIPIDTIRFSANLRSAVTLPNLLVMPVSPLNAQEQLRKHADDSGRRHSQVTRTTWRRPHRELRCVSSSSRCGECSVGVRTCGPPRSGGRSRVRRTGRLERLVNRRIGLDQQTVTPFAVSPPLEAIKVMVSDPVRSATHVTGVVPACLALSSVFPHVQFRGGYRRDVGGFTRPAQCRVVGVENLNPQRHGALVDALARPRVPDPVVPWALDDAL